ncbi:bifunctional DNA-formamidopyrimidine glycosylase/DNA-(apurinic or apyrimidinic site) lyase [Pseudodesulfovibrio sp. zrk46]|uniref:bifunctional DNA-formamidopyrimidine glycosylase/DNA-(apurinic or apyrimidinic site) lyase n=1 Tax=Pseudodesulfovibrio sp. zrk46 TaxID=2725288 RepID=UPI001448C314|nr:bifunctional DNA-formamidopyrimidine glycosylase/DNA-(apurinic or apyrimidinic site) lyase [Pseudodesulfovibrio sp. zrk46]QJB56108.1 bifunctional DNA-formamidopyrimidine glycosylase/DNA-(apurinic or apyrimidinic site) lyase [Pseudodesulfovibrio sp. zrk46]
MPELPEVEVIARGLHSTLEGRTVEAVPYADLTRLSEPADTLLPKLPGSTVKRVYRRAKVLLIEMTDGMSLGFHLKMTGRVVHGPMREPDKHDRLFMSLDDGSLLSFADMRKFGYVRSFTPGELEKWEFLCKCGPEPLETTPEVLADRLKDRKSAIKGVLLNQAVVVGIGNIYADEALFRAGIHPETKAHRISRSKAIKLFTEIQAVLKQAIAENGSSIRDYVNASGDAGAFQNNFNVYGRKGEECRICKGTLQAVKVAGRTSTFCPKCQQKR